LRECQHRFGQAAWQGERHRAKLVLGIELVDRFVGCIVGRMFDAELRRIGRWFRLGENRMPDRGSDQCFRLNAPEKQAPRASADAGGAEPCTFLRSVF
jgi:hypothetical protein